MIRLPIAERELRVRARRGSTHAIRVGAVVTAMVIAFIASGFALMAGGGGRGGALFTTLSIIAFILCLFEGVRQTADCLSEEKRAGTLGLLFLTDLQGYDVVLGKLAACGLNAVYALLGAAPILGFPLLLGGVTGGEFTRVVLILLNTLFFSMAIGIWASSLSRNPGAAWALALGMIALISVLSPLGLAPLEAGRLNKDTFLGQLFIGLGQVTVGISPVSAMFIEFSRPGGSAPGFWTCLAGGFGVGCFFLWRASRAVPTSWQDEPVPPTVIYPPPSPDFSPPVAEGAVAETSGDASPQFVSENPLVTNVRRRRRLLGMSPVVWLALRKTEGRLSVWGVAGGGSLIAAWLLWAGGNETAPLGIFFLWATKLALRIWVAVVAGRVFVEGRKSGALELLLSTPMTPRQVIQGQWIALRHLFLWPALVLGSMDVWLKTWSIWTGIGLHVVEQNEYFMVVLSAVEFPLNLIALAYVSMYLALKLRKPTQAAGLSVLLVYVLLGMFCPSPASVFVDVVLILYVRSQLEGRLRATVAQHR